LRVKQLPERQKISGFYAQRGLKKMEGIQKDGKIEENRQKNWCRFINRPRLGNCCSLAPHASRVLLLYIRSENNEVRHAGRVRPQATAISLSALILRRIYLAGWLNCQIREVAAGGVSDPEANQPFLPIAQRSDSQTWLLGTIDEGADL
jgi:hypothetical protein